MIVSWFSAGVSSAVATKLMLDAIDKIVYIHIDDQGDDSLRFVADCEKWYGREIEISQSPYKSVENACLNAGGRGYIAGPAGAACTKWLKKRVRKEWEADKGDLGYVWGFDLDEKKRINRIKETMSNNQHYFPLYDKGFTKGDAHKILNKSGIKRPKMYDLGYSNNNCVGCVKGGKGYWNKIRKDFPAVFKQRAEMERKVGASCINGTFLDELDPSAGRMEKPIVEECGIFCILESI